MPVAREHPQQLCFKMMHIVAVEIKHAEKTVNYYFFYDVSLRMGSRYTTIVSEERSRFIYGETRGIADDGETIAFHIFFSNQALPLLIIWDAAYQILFLLAA